MYVASTKPGGFQLEVSNNDSTLVICGLRVAVGAMDTQKVPTYLEVRILTYIIIIKSTGGIYYEKQVGYIVCLP